MFVLAGVLAVIILILLTRLGVCAEYGSDGIVVSASIGFIKLRVYPQKPRAAREKVKKRKKSKKVKKVEAEAEKPGVLENFKRMQPAIFETMSRIKRRLLIKELRVYYIAAGENAAFTALSFGAANAFFGVLSAQLENLFRVKKRDFRASADFNSTKTRVYIRAAFSLAVWESFYIAFALLPLLGGKSKKNAGKEVQSYGQASNR